MRIIVAGGRDFDDEEKFFNVMESELKEIRKHHDVIEIVSGHCSGADALGEKFAQKENLLLKTFPAQWNKFGRAAGPMRNAEMCRYAKQDSGMLIAFWDGRSRGTKNIIRKALGCNLKVTIAYYNRE